MSTDPPLPGNAPPRPPITPGQGEPLWTLHRNGERISAELRYHGEYGVEAQLMRNEGLLIGRSVGTRALAVQWAEEERQHLQADGWIAPG